MSSIVETLVQVADVESSSVKTIKYTDKHKLMVYTCMWFIDTLRANRLLDEINENFNISNTRKLVRQLIPVLNDESDEEKGKFFANLEKELKKANSKQAIAKMEKDAEKAAAKAAKDAEKAAAKAAKDAEKAAAKAAKDAEKAAAKAVKDAEKAAAKAAKAAEKKAAKAKADPVQELIRLAATDGASEQTKKVKKTKKDKEVITTQTNMIDELCASINTPPVAVEVPSAPAKVDKAAAKAAKDAEKAAAKAAKDAEKAAAKAAKSSPVASAPSTPTKVDNSQLQEEVIEDNFEENYENWTFEGKNYFKNKHTNEVVEMNDDGELEMIGVYNKDKNVIEEDDEEDSE